MSSVQTVQLLVISVVVGGVLGFLGALPYLKKKGINIDTANSIVKASEPVINIASTLMPGNHVIDLLKTIEKWAVIAVGQAQQLYHAGSIEEGNRKQVAEDAVYKVLQELNIELTASRKDLINAAIENAVNDLGHKEPTESEKESEKQSLQIQVTQLTSENATLKNTIAQVNATTSNVVQPSAQ